MCPRAFPINLLVEFHFVILERPVLVVLLDPVSVSFKSPFFRQTLLICLFQLYFQTCLLFCFFHLDILPCFFLPWHLRLLLQFLYLSFSLISIQVLYFYSGTLGEHRFYHKQILLQQKFTRWIQWCMLGYLVITCLSFRFIPWFFSSLFCWEMVR